MKRLPVLVAAFAAVAALLQPLVVRAVSVNGVAKDVPYVIGYHRLGALNQPFLGEMRLNFNDGVISGRYTDISIRPNSPFANRRNVVVSGGITNGALTLNIGGAMFHGSIREGWMTGSATIRGTVYVFEAEQGSPGRRH